VNQCACTATETSTPASSEGQRQQHQHSSREQLLGPSPSRASVAWGAEAATAAARPRWRTSEPVCTPLQQSASVGAIGGCGRPCWRSNVVVAHLPSAVTWPPFLVDAAQQTVRDGPTACWAAIELVSRLVPCHVLCGFGLVWQCLWAFARSGWPWWSACVEGWVALCSVVPLGVLCAVCGWSRPQAWRCVVLLCVVMCPSRYFVRCVAGIRRQHGVVSCCFV